MGAIGNYWRRAMAGINSAFGREAGLRSWLARLERQLLALSGEMQTLDGKQERNRAEAAHNRSELLRRIDGLDHACREYDRARSEAAARLNECEQRISGLETGRSQDGETISALKDSVVETTQRLETRNRQIKFLQDSAREQLQGFKSELAETRSRLETRDDETNRRMDEEHQLIVSLENSLTETRGRIEAVDEEIGTLHRDVAEQRLQIERFLDSATAQLEVANNRATLLEARLQADVELKEKQLEQMNLRLQQQHTRLVWSIAAVAVVLALLATLVILS